MNKYLVWLIIVGFGALLYNDYRKNQIRYKAEIKK